MKNKELVTELAARMGWTAQEVAETLSVLSSVVSSRLVDNDTIYLQGFGQFEVKKKRNGSLSILQTENGI
ncbi:putative uncharacterized protein [Parabacteroides merdae CAG:48]|nr:putative uncharacterized protein [Parabacteroides merdae CAG:48]